MVEVMVKVIINKLHLLSNLINKTEMSVRAAKPILTEFSMADRGFGVL